MVKSYCVKQKKQTECVSALVNVMSTSQEWKNYDVFLYLC